MATDKSRGIYGFVCKHCDKRFDGYPRVFCNAVCRLAHQYDSRPADKRGRYSNTCQRCGTSWTGNPRKWCSRECGVMAKQEALWRTLTCERCGATFTTNWKTKRRFCSKRCSWDTWYDAHPGKRNEYANNPTAKAYARRQWERLAPARAIASAKRRLLRALRALLAQRTIAERKAARAVSPCTQCGGPVGYDGMGRTRLFCSDECLKASPGFRALRRASKAVRRARQRMLPYESFDPLEVLHRDGWTCQLCGIATPQRLRGTTKDNAPELDHIVALAAGGHHTRANTQCACRRCNRAKSAGPPRGQMGLWVSEGG